MSGVRYRGVDIDAHLSTEQVGRISTELRRAAVPGMLESEFRLVAARILASAAEEIGIQLAPRDEFVVAHGRADAVYNRFILEYKRPGAISSSNAAAPNKAVIAQVQKYILDVAARERRDVERIAGAACDGARFVFVRRVGDGWEVDAPIDLETGLERFLRLLFSLSQGRALVAENLVEDFGPKSDRAKSAIASLHGALRGTDSPLVRRLLEQWRTFFSQATSFTEESAVEKLSEFVRDLGLDQKTSRGEVLYTVQTYYALLVKLVALLAAAQFQRATVAIPEGGEGLKVFLRDLENGGLFKGAGIRNFLEGDLFGWYLDAWRSDVASAIGDMSGRLQQYDPGTLELAPENARDVLKKLYHRLLPKEVRHDLGEYYTPDWLAERLLTQTLGEADLGNPRKRILDPACGSGTFLVLAIEHARRRASTLKLAPRETLDLILRNVVGIDLNPLAVIAARANYLFALGDLLSHRSGPIDLPVYEADSVLTPSGTESLLDGHSFDLATSVRTFRVPAAFATQERVDVLTTALDDAVRARDGEESFVRNLEKSRHLDLQTIEAARPGLIALLRDLQELHDAGLNGVWARVIKNAFAPLFLDQFDYVVGNPPWVNWQSLPPTYRERTKELWQHYGLFPHTGMDTILGKSKKDIAMLMTYVAVDRYLKPRGKLGFVVSQTLFKTSGAGEGFRRFQLPSGVPFGPLIVEDMVELNPFEGASNRTAVAIFLKGYAVRYPVSYLEWKKKRRGAIAFDTPYEAVTSEHITFRQLFARPVEPGNLLAPWITSTRQALDALIPILGPSQYRAYEGANTGGANGVFWVRVASQGPGNLATVTNVTEGARRIANVVTARVERELLHALLRGRDADKWMSKPSIHLLMTQDPTTRRGIASDRMASDFPMALSYLEGFADLLKQRPALRRYFRPGDPYWSMFNVGAYTFSPWKVVWRYISSGLACCVVGPDEEGRPVIPDCKLMLVPTSTEAEAHYVAAVLNSSPAALAVHAYTVSTQISTHVMEHVAVPKYDPDLAGHRALSGLSKQAHQAARRSDAKAVMSIESDLDFEAARLWSLSPNDVREIARALPTTRRSSRAAEEA